METNGVSWYERPQGQESSQLSPLSILFSVCSWWREDLGSWVSCHLHCLFRKVKALVIFASCFLSLLLGVVCFGPKMVEDAMAGNKVVDGVTSTRISWRSRKRSVSERSVSEEGIDAADMRTPEKLENAQVDEKMQDSTQTPELSERRKALFEPLEPPGSIRSRRMSAESLLPPPDFDSASYPKGWLIGKRRKLVNVDVVESMRRIAVQEMNRKDREIDGLNEQLEEDARCLEHLQLQLLDEKSKRAEIERENTMLRDQISMLMTMMDENEPLEDGQDPEEP